MTSRTSGATNPVVLVGQGRVALLNEFVLLGNRRGDNRFKRDDPGLDLGALGAQRVTVIAQGRPPPRSLASKCDKSPARV